MNLPEDSDTPFNDPLLQSLEPDFLVGAGRYSLRHIIAARTFSVVWLTWDNQLNEEVALKFYSSEFTSNFDALNELRLAVQRSRKLSHPNILRLHEFYSAPGEAAFVAMEYFDAADLGRLRLDRPAQVFSWEELRPLMLQASSALEYAHSEGQSHGNLRPSNMLIDRRGRLKLADYGLPLPPPELLKTLSDASAPKILPWLSPQRLETDSANVQNDIYSFGAVIYALLTGSPPFYLGDIPHQVRNVRPQALQDRLKEFGVESEIPPEADALVLACLAKEQKERPASFSLISQWLNPPPNPTPSQPENIPVHEPISLIPPKRETASRRQGQKAVEEAAAFENSLPQVNEDETSEIGSSEDNRLTRATPAKIAVIAAALLILGAIAGWMLNRHRNETIKANSTTPDTSPGLPIDTPASQEQIGLSEPPGQQAELPHGTYVGKGPAFTYHYAPREVLGLDTNAVNMGVKFGREGPQDQNCSYIMTEGKTNNSLGTITYQFRAAPGYLIEDMSLSQSVALFTSGRVRGVYSVDEGKTFSDFYLTPPYRGTSFGFHRTATLYSLKAPSVLVRYIIQRYAGNDYNLQFLRDCDDGTEMLEISGSVVPELANSSAEEFSATPAYAKGLKTVEWEDGAFARAEKQGVNSWILPELNTPHYLYFNIEDEFRPRKTGVLMLEAEYLDIGSGELLLQYDSKQPELPDQGAYKAHPESIRRLNTGRWQKTSWILSDAKFEGRQNGDADFRIYVSGDELAIRKVRLVVLGQ